MAGAAFALRVLRCIKAVISLRNRQIRKYAKEQFGTSVLRWRLLRICIFRLVFVTAQTADTQERTFGPCQPHICSRLPLLPTAPSCRQGRFQSSLGAIVVSPKKLTPWLPPPPPCGRALPAVTPRMSILLRANCAKQRGPGFRVQFSLSKEIRPTLPPSRHAGAVSRGPPLRRGGFCLLVSLPHEVQRIRRMHG